jgi:hypothetical protein
MGREKSKKQDLRHPDTQHKEEYEDTWMHEDTYIVATKEEYEDTYIGHAA